jgi:hypothetical protein
MRCVHCGQQTGYEESVRGTSQALLEAQWKIHELHAGLAELTATARAADVFSKENHATYTHIDNSSGARPGDAGPDS